MRLIDTDALIEALDSFILDEVTDVHGDTVREILERLTTIERKTGKWEQDPLAKALDVYICSECKQPLQCRGEYGSLAKVNFCPTCGARMEV